MQFILPGIAAALVMFLVMLQLDVRKFTGYHAFIDLTFTFVLFWAFNGTYSGTMTAVSGGITLTALLLCTRYLFGYKLYDTRKRRWIFHAR